ncbi:ATP-dependent RNA helicase HrpA [Actinophytocola gossypii]|uniref:ATP-dependent RNA helicase HrpA n=1 Tax=Actinophytocola gossypii TaxID=2812003 RepID=A0ABT2J6U6_9PSEU|nr:ATP-dependent RNA helicase HrpA [Actinophytocola gossypii]MCT2583581.1 ATP-dependent RNA helicase HrpA [Actinophytocola gossypii]
MTLPSSTSLRDLRSRLSEVTLRDERRLRRRLDGLGKIRDQAARQARIDEIAAEVDRAAQRVERRRANVPAVTYPDELPISQRRDEIAKAIAEHQVVIVAGETGSGKTTQLPKICLELGRGVRGMIGHTQPRRIAARTVAERVSDELDVPLGGAVGWKIRFTDQAGDNTLIKLMTDGILLAELQSDRMLRQYDTLIIDEAHERSLNVDFILGYLKQLLPRRPDLKVIITSATIDPERFSRHFDDAPIVEVSGRTYPVEVRYRPIVDPEDPDADPDRDQTQAIMDAVDELSAEGPGDILVFLSGEREIRDTADALAAQNRRDTEILPLYARLSHGEQRRVFQPHRGRRVVLATNVAETSLTVPGIKYVIDPGFARISRYSNRLKVQRLPIEPVSQASANQRKGRCGRTSDGICVRLYSEDDFDARPEFTDPEILRTNLASVILQMAAADLGDIAAFPFVEPPDRRHITDGMNLLNELGALESSTKDSEPRLTPLGRKLARLPVDPRLARMVLAAHDNACVSEVVVIAAALSIQDPRERPVDKQAQADQQHARFRDPESDFLSLLNLWRYLTEQRAELSANRFRRLCRAEFLNYLRIREWQDVAGQLRQMAKSLDVTANDIPAEPAAIHRSLLTGLLSHLGLKDTAGKEYLGARNAKFAIFPGSALFRKQPRWVMAAELVETSRLWGRVVARVDPAWIEPVAGHLVRRTYSEPRWEKKRAAVMASERVTLFGLPIVVDRPVNFGRIDPPVARALFIRHALVQGEWHSDHKFLRRNADLLAEAEELEHKARRRDIVVDEQSLFEFYDDRVPEEVVSGRHFDTWWKKTRRDQPDLLTFDPAMLVNPDAGDVSAEAFPDAMAHNELELGLRYRFEPGEVTDGVTVQVPLALLNRVSADGLPWQVPGLRAELITALLRSLPKPLRRNFVPVPDFANALRSRLDDVPEPTLAQVSAELRDLTGVVVPSDAWQLDQVPQHLRTTFQVVDEGKPVLTGKDLGVLKRELASRVRESLASGAEGVTREGLTSWSFDTLERSVSLRRAGQQVTAYPALVDTGSSVAIRLFDTEAEQARAMWRGTRRLVLLTVPAPVKQVVRRLPNTAKLALSANPHGSVPGLLEDCLNAATDALVAQHGGPVWTPDDFQKLCAGVRAGLADTLYQVLDRVRGVLTTHAEVDAALARMTGKVFAESVADMRAQVAGLVFDGFVTATGVARLSDVERYLRGVLRRLEKLPERPSRDLEWTYAAQDAAAAYAEVRGRPGDDGRVRWMIEELRISYFAQTLGTAYPISEKRVYRAIDELA